MKKLILVLLFILYANVIFAQLFHTRSLGWHDALGYKMSKGVNVIYEESGNIVCLISAGPGHDVITRAGTISKYNSIGTLIWSKTLTADGVNSGVDPYVEFTRIKRVYSPNKSLDGYILIGFERSVGTENICNFYMTLLDTNGNQIWEKIYKPGGGAMALPMIFPLSVEVKNYKKLGMPISIQTESAFFVSGFVSEFDGTMTGPYVPDPDLSRKKIWAACFDYQGEMIWSKTYHPDNSSAEPYYAMSNQIIAIDEGMTGKYFIGGSGDYLATGLQKGLGILIDSLGNVIWDSHYMYNNTAGIETIVNAVDFGNSIAILANNTHVHGLAVFCVDKATGVVNSNMSLDINLLAGSNQPTGHTMKKTPEGELVVSGYVGITDNTVNPPIINQRPFIIRFRPEEDGNVTSTAYTTYTIDCDMFYNETGWDFFSVKSGAEFPIIYTNDMIGVSKAVSGESPYYITLATGEDVAPMHDTEFWKSLLKVNSDLEACSDYDERSADFDPFSPIQSNPLIIIDNYEIEEDDPWSEFMDPDIEQVYVCSGETKPLNSPFQKKSSIRIYPNPANDYITIDIKGVIPSKIIIYDMNGKTVNELKKIETHMKLDTKDYEPGVYSIKIFTGEYISTHKLIIQH